MKKRNLRHLKFIVQANSKILVEGEWHDVYKSLHKDIHNEVDNLKGVPLEDLVREDIGDFEVLAIDNQNKCPLDTMSAEKWLEWWNKLVLVALSENGYDDDLMIEYPDSGREIEEL